MNAQIQQPPMNQTEIFQNMTKGEWKADEPQKNDAGVHFTYIRGSAHDTERIVGRIFHTWGKNSLAATANGICSAVNNTYGRGINPESVEKMKDLLTKIAGFDPAKEFNRRTPEDVTPYEMDMSFVQLQDWAKEALTAAKL